MIDLHCHVLPGLDDGPQALTDSLAMCRAAAGAGTRTIVATPHVSPQWPQNTPPIIASAVSLLTEVLSHQGLGLTVVPGAEVAMSAAAKMSDEHLWGYHLGGGPWLLMECPHSPSAAGFDRLLYTLQERNHRIVLAHPERCLAFHRDPGALAALLRAGMLCSITAGSLAGRFGRTVQHFAQRLLRDGLVHNIASDGHNVTHRPPLSPADLEAAGLAQGEADWYLERVPRAILDGDEIPPRAPASAGATTAGPQATPVDSGSRAAARSAESPPEVDVSTERYREQISEARSQLVKLRETLSRLREEIIRADDQRDEAYRERDRAVEERDRAEVWLASVASELEHVEGQLTARRADLASVAQIEPQRNAAPGRR